VCVEVGGPPPATDPTTASVPGEKALLGRLVAPGRHAEDACRAEPGLRRAHQRRRPARRPPAPSRDGAAANVGGDGATGARAGTPRVAEIDDEALAKRILRPDQPRLTEAQAAVEGLTDPREAWEVLATRGVIPADWIDAPNRRFLAVCPFDVVTVERVENRTATRTDGPGGTAALRRPDGGH